MSAFPCSLCVSFIAVYRSLSQAGLFMNYFYFFLPLLIGQKFIQEQALDMRGKGINNQLVICESIMILVTQKIAKIINNQGRMYEANKMKVEHLRFKKLRKIH